MSRYLESGKFRGEILDGDYASVWIPFNKQIPGGGLIFCDAPIKNIPDMIKMLEKIQKKARK